MPNPLTTPVLVSQLVGSMKPYWVATSDRLPPSHPAKMEEPQTAVLPWLWLISVVHWWLMLDDWLLLYPLHVIHLWFQQKQMREATVTTEALLRGGQLLAVSHCRGNRLKSNHWILHQTHQLHQYWCLSVTSIGVWDTNTGVYIVGGFSVISSDYSSIYFLCSF